MIVSELKTVIDRFEGKEAVLAYGKEFILWPKDKLPTNSKEGDAIVLIAKRDMDATKDREDLARTVLNELLQKD